MTAQREIEIAVRDGLGSGALAGSETLPARATITIEGLSEEVVVEGAISLT